MRGGTFVRFFGLSARLTLEQFRNLLREIVLGRSQSRTCRAAYAARTCR